VANTLTPREIAPRERIFERRGVLRNGCTDQILGHCTIGMSFSTILADQAGYNGLLRIFSKERYILCFDARSAPRNRPRSRRPRMHICLKESHTPLDHLKAWVHAEEIGRACTGLSADDKDDVGVIESTYRTVCHHFPAFVEEMRGLGWNLDDGALITGPPDSVFLSADEVFDIPSHQDNKKDI
jgi:hypothetical protein